MEDKNSSRDVSRLSAGDYIRIRQMVRLLRRKIIPIAAVSLIGTLLLSVYFNFIVPRSVTVTATLHILPKIDDPWLDVATINLRYSAYNDTLRNITQIAKSDYVIRAAVEEAELDRTFVREWDSRVSANFLPNTGLLKITASTPDLDRSEIITASFMNILINEVEKSYPNVRIVVAAPIEQDLDDSGLLRFGPVWMLLTLLCFGAAVWTAYAIHYFFGDRIIHEGDLLRFTAYPLLQRVEKGNEKAAARMIHGILRANPATQGYTSLAVSCVRTDPQTTQIIASLGRMFQQNHTKVLVIDADLTRKALSSLMGVSQSGGVCEYLLGDISLEDIKNFVVKSDGGPDILPAGKTFPKNEYPANSMSIMDLLPLLKTDYDRIILFTGALDDASESLVLSSLADISILFFQQGQIQADRFEKICSDLRHLRSRLAGFVMTDAFL